MRPEILYILFNPLTQVKGIGKITLQKLCKLGCTKLIDLLFHLPYSFIDRRYSPNIPNAIPSKIATFKVTVNHHEPPKKRNSPYKIICSNESGFLYLVFFKGQEQYLKSELPEGSVRIISGKVEFFNDTLQITHPDYIGKEEDESLIKKIEPIYPLTANLSNKVLIKHIQEALKSIPNLPEWQNDADLKAKGWPSFKESLIKLHNPQSEEDLKETNKARQRLAYDELLSNQLALSIIRHYEGIFKGTSIKGDGNLRFKLLENLPFSLTSAQKRVIKEINEDMASTNKMLRLLQGDVGSGKTIVALFTMLNAIECGYQACIMAPTDILASQHYENLKPFCDKIGVKISFISSKIKGKERQNILTDLESGLTQIIIGTHSLFQKDIKFKDLKLCVIDEQHRFGVFQRLKLAEKGLNPDILVMTATPIPRTLTLTVFGDMECSKIDEMPKGRQEITTKSMPISKIPEIIEAIKRNLAQKNKTYWVCPLVEESEKLDLAAAVKRFEYLQTIFKSKVGLIHGKMKPAEKDTVMADFINDKIDILVATTVIEVGINVPSATVMIVEHAERFGLAALHQLRGRVGRSDKKSFCILLYAPPLSETAKSRINIMRETTDGFLIAEEDLKLRGGGELLGTKQSGFPEFKLADLIYHQELLSIANKEARLIINKDPELKTPRGQNLRTLLYLFEQDKYVKTLQSG